LNFSSESDVFTDFVLEEMSIALVNGKGLTVVDRKEIELIRGEMNFQMSGDVSDESAQAIGMMLGAQSIISGSLVSMGDTYRFRTKAINVISAAIETSSSISVKSDSQIQYLLTQGRRTSPATAVAQGGAQSNTQVQPTPAQAQPQPATPAGPALPSYRIGDAGPAGGLIFYDKGNNSGGWRYLEAAPEEVEFQAIWSVHNTAVENTRAEIGRGTQNTRLIVEKLRQTSGEWDTAAQKANDLVFNGFDDWFLPSKDELDQMYGNLKRRNLGEFRDEWYWSSTENPSADWRGYAWAQSFKDGRMYHQVQKLNNRLYVRAIRQVPGQ
jgi:TolB-like protein